MIVGDEESNGRFALMETFIPPGKGGPFHIHRNEDEVFIVTQGEMVFYGDNERRIYAPTGTVVSCPPGSVRGFRNETDELAKMLIYYSKAGIDRMIEMDGTSVEADVEVVENSDDEPLACPDLSKQFGIEDLDDPLPFVQRPNK
ncbi:cupin domain-containing protein [Sphingorhabdus sp. EL138]|uniref:cupin domain-containing protein n=1 Tax=Sphingorhabdus sp. EL138 TaxID=2073156 RepID=UPI0013A578B2|nr:cupin domain-containing protein [Sphingorhabdus sp. EL138]